MGRTVQDIVRSDDNLAGHEEHLKYRYSQFLATKDSIEKNEGSLAEFAKVRCPPGQGCILSVDTVFVRGFGTYIHTIERRRVLNTPGIAQLACTCWEKVQIGASAVWGLGRCG